MTDRVWITRGTITDADSWEGQTITTPKGKVRPVRVGDTEWSFSDGPAGRRGGSSDYVDLAAALADHSGQIIVWDRSETAPQEARGYDVDFEFPGFGERVQMTFVWAAEPPQTADGWLALALDSFGDHAALVGDILESRKAAGARLRIVTRCWMDDGGRTVRVWPPADD